MAVFAGEKSSKDIITNDITSDDDVVASDVPPRYLLFYCIHVSPKWREKINPKRSSLKSVFSFPEPVWSVRFRVLAQNLLLLTY